MKITRKIIISSVCFFIILIISMPVITTYALTCKPSVERYVLDENENFAVKNADLLDENKNFEYGGFSLGSLSVNGVSQEQEKYNGFTAYTANSNVTFSYFSDTSEYQTDNEKQWNLNSSSANKISGVDIKKIKSGAVLVQVNSTGTDWEKADSISVSDIFDDKSKLTDFYTVTEDELKEGRFYRVSIAYEMCKKKNITTKYTKRFIEVYKFYIGNL